MSKHTTITVDSKLYAEFKEFCNTGGYSISKLTEKLIKEKIYGIQDNLRATDKKSANRESK